MFEVLFFAFTDGGVFAPDVITHTVPGGEFATAEEVEEFLSSTQWPKGFPFARIIADGEKLEDRAA